MTGLSGLSGLSWSGGSGAAAFTPGELASIGPSLSIALQRSLGLLWQERDGSRVTPAVDDGDRVGEAVCPWTDESYFAPSDDARPLLTDEGGGKWSLTFDGADDYLAAATGPAGFPLDLAAAHLSADTDGIVAGANFNAGQNVCIYRGGADTLAGLVQNSGNKLYAPVTAADGDWHVAEVTLTGTLASFSGTVRLEGVTVAGPTAGVDANLTDYQWVVGGMLNGNSPTAMQLAGFIPCTAELSAGDRALRLAYLQALVPL